MPEPWISTYLVTAQNCGNEDVSTILFHCSKHHNHHHRCEGRQYNNSWMWWSQIYIYSLCKQHMEHSRQCDRSFTECDKDYMCVKVSQRCGLPGICSHKQWLQSVHTHSGCRSDPATTSCFWWTKLHGEPAVEWVYTSTRALHGYSKYKVMSHVIIYDMLCWLCHFMLLVKIC